MRSSAPTSSKAARSSSTRRRPRSRARSRAPREHRQRQGLASGRNAHLDPPRARADRNAVPARRRPVEAIETGEPTATSRTSEEEDAAEALGISKLLEVYAPIEADGEVVGAYEIYADGPLEASIADRRRLIWATTACVFALLWLALALLVRTASKTLSRQTEVLRERSRALADSYQRLEENALEAVETLNATVEAKDPYTAGHSRRVQRIAVAVGEELGFTPKQLEALRFGGMFHDIGKLAIPDSILTKPAKLTPEEYERIKEHSAEGARIVAKLGRLREAVPSSATTTSAGTGAATPTVSPDGDPACRGRGRPRGRVGRHDHGAAVPPGPRPGRGLRRGSRRPRDAVRPGGRRRVLLSCAKAARRAGHPRRRSGRRGARRR